MCPPPVDLDRRGRITPDARNTLTVTDAIDRWLTEKEAEGLRATSLHNLTVSLRVHVGPRTLGRMRAIDVRAGHIVALYRDLRDHGLAVGHGKAGRCRTSGVTCRNFPAWAPDRHRGLSGKSRLHVHGALRGLFAWLIEEGVIVVNPCEERRVRKNLPERVKDDYQVTQDDYWSSAAARAFIDTCRSAHDPPHGTLGGRPRDRSPQGRTRWAHVALRRPGRRGHPCPAVHDGGARAGRDDRGEGQGGGQDTRGPP